MYTLSINGSKVARFNSLAKAMEFGARVRKIYADVKLAFIKG